MHRLSLLEKVICIATWMTTPKKFLCKGHSTDGRDGFKSLSIE